jgi:hypothetical protein
MAAPLRSPAAPHGWLKKVRLQCELLETRQVFSLGLTDVLPVVSADVAIGNDGCVEVSVVPEELPPTSDTDIVVATPPVSEPLPWINDSDIWFEEDQIVWYMPWFGDDDRGQIASIELDQSGPFEEPMVFFVDAVQDAYSLRYLGYNPSSSHIALVHQVPNFPVGHGQQLPPLQPPVYERVVNEEPLAIQISVACGDSAEPYYCWMATSAGPSRVRAESFVGSTLVPSAPLAVASTAAAPQPWLWALAPEAATLQLYTPPQIESPAHDEVNPPLAFVPTTDVVNIAKS